MEIKLEHINKSFGAKDVLKDVSVNFSSGKINALLGENGAGKSTLAKIIAGFPCVKIVRQEPLLSKKITVRQNILAGTNIKKSDFTNRLENLQKQWCPSLDLNKKVSDCTSSQKFFTSLLSCLITNPEVLILDEPGRTLEWHERRLLYAGIRNLASSGMNIIIITHSIEEARLYTDTITVLEQGKITAFYEKSMDFDSSKHNFSTSDFNDFSLNPKNENSSPLSGDFLFKIEDLICRPKFRFPLELKELSVEKEKVTLVQSPGTGKIFTLENILFGLEKSSVKGKLFWNYKNKTKKKNLSFFPITPIFVRNMFGKNSVGLVSANKLFRSSNPDLTVEQMLTPVWKNKFFFPDTEKTASDIINKAQVNACPKDKTSSLSGGMLQKLILERELNKTPKLLILCEPLQGLDNNSAIETCRRIKALTYSGKTVLVLSSTEYPTFFADRIFCF